MAYDVRNSHWFRVLRNAMLAFDSWVNSTLYNAGAEAAELWQDFSGFMENFHVRGATRVAVELACEGLTLGVFGGLVMVVLAQPAVRLTASGDWLKKSDLAVTFQDRYGAEVGRRGILHDDAVTLDQYPEYVVQAVLATEDRRFFEHWGVDPIGLLRALTVNARSSGVVQGGSTLTQQLAKNLFLSNERTLTRKINEAFLAFWLELHLTKRQILQLYLDRAYMGGGAFGIQAAAQFYFGRSIKDVTLAQAAMLAGLFKAPTKFAPHVNLPAARARAADVLNNLVAAGYMRENQIADALQNPASAVDRSAEASSPDWYLDWAFIEVKALADEGKLGSERVVTVRTALDSGLQKKAETTIEQMLRDHGPSFNAKQGATVILEPLGAVRAMVGGRDYGVSQFNRATDAQRQPGSSFKPYVYLTALMSGFHAADDRGGCAVLHRQLVPEELWQQIWRLHAALERPRPFAEHGGGAPFAGGRRRQRQTRAGPRSSPRRIGLASPRPCPTPSLCRWAPTRSASWTRRRAIPPSPMAASASSPMPRWRSSTAAAT